MCFHYSHLGAELFSSQNADTLQRNTIKYGLCVHGFVSGIGGGSYE